jgi:cytochrome c556
MSVAMLAMTPTAGCRSKPTGATEPPPGTPEPAPARKAPDTPEPEPPESEELPDLMKDHFSLASQARDAVVRGRLEQAEGPLVWLGQHALAKDMPSTWRLHVERMQQAARRALTEGTLASAGQAIGATAAECGACHTMVHRGPKFEPSDFNDLRESDTKGARAELQERMHGHLWAIERMWEGLVGPSDDAWRAGAETLREGQGHPRVAKAASKRLELVRSLGGEARDVTDGAGRAAIYGRILAECGGCHAGSGVELGGPGTADEPR